ncbi:uncharacterized protein MONBRDRAFT_31734 [Monosiga brevicollis MX1]|uniref:Elongator complex protein 2 n=1 Tax=Monosiga brevicollis TaxID=81824 RepID=A9UUC8_MONBE|nr:uncharacterized protein MONBRDRAFT_31734 [Monosiga brevicollis MX1]EDQ90881.1 predicted protein [Monosiga brevicollis MX1]|eukprot:XP_001744178.1 hypothetical protein [Monosiga brevicollis MX1]
MELCSAACSASTGAARWQRGTSVYAYGAGRRLLIVDTQEAREPRVVAALLGHTDRINCVAWLPNTDIVLSGATDATLRIWAKNPDTELYGCIAVLEGHTRSVVAVTALQLHDGSHLVASASADHTVRLWHGASSSSWAPVQTIECGRHFALCLALDYLPGETSAVILAAGLSNAKLHLYAGATPTADNTFNLAEVDIVAGHDDWIRALAFTRRGDELLLASGAQDSYIRLWSIATTQSTMLVNQDDFNALLESSERRFTVAEQLTFRLRLEALLIGHDGQVYGLDWSYASDEDITLLSASADKTMMLWKYDKKADVWLDEARLGEVGGNTLGFFGCCFGANDNEVLSHGYQGAFHFWRRSETGKAWQPQTVLSGHFAAVRDVAWSPDGRFVLSVSEDQSVRLFAQATGHAGWHELARPQVHGYNMRCLAFTGDLAFVSGADEKVLRAFEAPATFVSSFANVNGHQYPERAERPFGASVPALGLSNKAISSDEHNATVQEEQLGYRATPPLEEDLIQNTLWPESAKLYGHGYEILAVGAARTQRVLATTCKLGRLAGHTLSVVKLAFSHNEAYLASVSRDRSICLHRRTPDAEQPYGDTNVFPKAHDRIIWFVQIDQGLVGCRRPADTCNCIAQATQQRHLGCLSSTSDYLCCAMKLLKPHRAARQTKATHEVQQLNMINMSIAGTHLDHLTSTNKRFMFDTAEARPRALSLSLSNSLSQTLSLSLKLFFQRTTGGW